MERERAEVTGKFSNSAYYMANAKGVRETE